MSDNKSGLYKVIEDKVIGIINPPKDEIKRPGNRLWIAVLGFNLTYLAIDLITSVTVGYLTYWYYGVLVFLAGFLPMVAHESLFANPYASKIQRWISGIGFGFSILSALSVGVMVVVINVLYDSTPTGKTLEAVAMGLLFLIAIAHGTLLALYFFIDEGIRAVQNALTAMAKNEQKLHELGMAGQIVDKSKTVIDALEKRANAGEGGLMDAAMEAISGDEWRKAGNKPQQPQRGYANETQTPINSTKNAGENERSAEKQDNTRPNQNGR
jgi:hypothetical protein